MCATKDSHSSELGQPQKDKYLLCFIMCGSNSLHKCIKTGVGMWYENKNKTVKGDKEDI